MSAIILDGVERSFGSKKVLQGVSARAEEGRVVGLLGRNGEGKTTLFKVMLDMLAADAGRVEIAGLGPDGTGALREAVGYIPERPVFHDFMTAREVFSLRAKYFRRWDPLKAESLAKELGLPLDQKVGGASKGTLGKLAWVCAAAHDPMVFLLDEPTSGLDALVREEVLAHLIEELQGSGKTFLIANHHMEELSGLLDEVWVLEGGRIVARHELEALRTQACRLTGRLKPGAAVPEGVIALPAVGALAQWAVLDSAAAERVGRARLLEEVSRSPLPVETALKLLLKERGGKTHA